MVNRHMRRLLKKLAKRQNPEEVLDAQDLQGRAEFRQGRGGGHKSSKERKSGKKKKK